MKTIDEQVKEYGDLGIRAKFPYVMIDEKNEVELSIGILDKCLYINFLGSVSKMDWIHNFMFWKKPYKKMKKLFFVHSGFLKIYKITQDRIHKFLEDNAGKFTSIVIGGHSLGGAISTLCFEDIKYLQESNGKGMSAEIPVYCVTTGAPRVFGLFGIDTIKKRCADMVRIVYKNDGVPSLPPVVLGYGHVGHLEQFGKRCVNILFPSFVYYHDTGAYKDRENFLTRKESEINNWLYLLAWKAYKTIYFAIAGVIAVAGIIIFLL